jgi:radical SAM superfamily enzyme YgiQ (UPF0313 family)
MPCYDIVGQGFPYIAGALKTAGHKIFGLNINYEWCLPTAKEYLKKRVEEAVRIHNPEIICVGGMSPDFYFVQHTIEFIRAISPNIIIICGGPMVTYDYEFIFSTLNPDYAIIGEGEESIVLLIEQLKNKESLSSIPGLIYKLNEKTIVSDLIYAQVKDLNALTFPEYSIFCIDDYLNDLKQTNHNYFYTHTNPNPRLMPLNMARGCPFRCTFCCHDYGPKYRSRSIDSVMKEIEYLYDNFKFNFLFIYDELFAKGSMNGLCDGIMKFKKERNIDFSWTCDFRVPDVKPEMLNKMKTTGCSFIGFGLESASPRVLKSMNKRVKVEQIHRAIKLSEEVKIGVQGNFIFGDPAETPETINETFDFYEKWCADHNIYFGHVTPYPGSQLFEYCLKNKIVDNRFELYSKLKTFGHRAFNMTQMETNSFHRHVDKLLAIHSPVDTHKEAKLLSCKMLGVADKRAPRNLRQHMFSIEVECPHCSSRTNYMASLPIREKIAVQACSSCHLRFKLPVEHNALLRFLIIFYEETFQVIFTYKKRFFKLKQRGFVGAYFILRKHMLHRLRKLTRTQLT